MDNLIRYCCDKGLHNFIDWKKERKSRIVMREHYVSNKDVIKYDLASYVQSDKFGRYKIPKYFLRKLSWIMSYILSGFICVEKRPGIVGQRGGTRIENKMEDIPRLLLNPNDEIQKMYDSIQKDLDKDLIRNRSIKIWNIKKKMKLWKQ